MSDKRVNIAVFASGSGTNAENLFKYFANHPKVAVSLLVCSNPNAGVIDKAANHKIPVLVLDRENFYNSKVFMEVLSAQSIGFIVLAGFLWMVPSYLIGAFKNRIINIHPSLLPKYGGKGMYGAKVHQAVLQQQELESGITIHYVNEQYDEGEVIIQAKTIIEPNETVESLQRKIQQLEHKHLPEIVEAVVTTLPVR